VLRLITFLPFSVLMFMVPVLLAVCMVFTCVPEVLYLLFGINTKCSTRHKLKSFVPTALVNVKRYLGSTLHYFLSSTYDVVTEHPTTTYQGTTVPAIVQEKGA